MPLRSQLHVDQLLTNISVKYKNSEYIGEQVFPFVPVKKDSDVYRIYTSNFRIPETKRAIKGKSRRHEFEVTTASYLLEKHSLHDLITDDEVENYDIADLRSDTTEELTDTIMRRVEKSVADLLTTTNWSLNVSLAAANAFNANTTVSNPIPYFDTAASTIVSNSGYRPNQAIIPLNTFNPIKNHVSVLDRIKYTSAAITEEMVASLFGLEKILVPISQQDTSAQGATSVIASIFQQDNCFIHYKPAKAGPKVPASGYIFTKNKNLVKRWRDEAYDGEFIEVNKSYQAKVVASLTGYLIRDTLA